MAYAQIKKKNNLLHYVGFVVIKYYNVPSLNNKDFI